MTYNITESAKLFSVSTATIRNWIKAGHLELESKGKISLNSILSFKRSELGKNKLNKRANKSNKGSHNHQNLTFHIFNEIQKVDSELLGNIYEQKLSDSYKNKEGIYYTPQPIVENLFKTFDDISKSTFCDPCCGSGNFIIQAIELGFKPENIYGFDIDPIAVEITKKRIYEKTGYTTDNIKCLDFLSLAANETPQCYDYIYTNPPWGKKLDKQEKKLISERLNSTLSNDTCSLFFVACLKTLKSNGILGLLLPESFFNVASFENSREELLNYNIKYLVDYGKAFKKLQTGAVAFILKKEIAIEEKILCEYNKKIFYRSRNSFLMNPKKIINIYANDEDECIIRHLLSIPHITLENNATWGLGIVTGNNSKYLLEKEMPNSIPIYKGSDITETGLKEPSNFIYPDFSNYQQVAPLSLFYAKEKLIYKFISSDLFFYYDENQSIILNSANMVITNDDFPISMRIIEKLFNSSLMRWLFKKIFNSYKILRSDLEVLPIYSQYLSHDNFNEITYINNLNLEKKEYGTFRIKNKDH